MHSPRSALAVLVVTLLTASCAGAPHADGPRPAPVTTTIRVTNNNWADMIVYAVHDGVRTRLGSVTSMTTERMVLPVRMTLPGELRIATDPIGGTEVFVTEPLQIHPGARVDLLIQNHLRISSYAVRNR